MRSESVTAEIVRERLNYDPESGEFAWKSVPRRSRAKVGSKAGSLDAHGYIQINLGGGRVLKAHRLAWLYSCGAWPDGDIDHINGDKTDNRISNLRVVSNAINCQNKRKPLPGNKSGFLGVSWNRGAWRATIMLNKKQYNLGRFATPQEAHLAYLAAKRRLHEGCSI